MEQIIELIKIILPAVLVFITAWVLLEKYLKHLPIKQDSNVLEAERLKILLPLQLSAYERLTIFMERIQPGSLVFRHNDISRSSARTQLELLKAVREEYEHNMSLQIYVSDDAWKFVIAAKDEVIEMIKLAGGKVGPDAGAMDFNRQLLEFDAQIKEGAVKRALKFLNLEIKIILGQSR
jgi:hypothetical protein